MMDGSACLESAGVGTMSTRRARTTTIMCCAALCASVREKRGRRRRGNAWRRRRGQGEVAEREMLGKPSKAVSTETRFHQRKMPSLVTCITHANTWTMTARRHGVSCNSAVCPTAPAPTKLLFLPLHHRVCAASDSRPLRPMHRSRTMHVSFVLHSCFIDRVSVLVCPLRLGPCPLQPRSCLPPPP